MKLSIVVPCRNAVKTIAAQLDALSHQQWRDAWEVIVADNGSTDGTQQVVESYYGRLPGLRLIDASDRRGAAHARNSAAKIATGDALVYCDADDEVGIGWLTAIGGALQAHDFVVSRMDVDKLNPPWLALTLNNVQGKEIRRAYYPPYLGHAGSSGMGVKKSLHDRVGGFDEALREREDTDYCFRIQLLGHELHFVAEATIHIRYNENPEVLFHQARRWGSYQALMYKRYGGGMPLDRPWASYFKTWRDLLACTPRIFDKQKRPAWMKTLGTQVGLLQGAILYQVPPVCETIPMERAMMEALVEKLMDPAIAPTCPAGDFRTAKPTQQTELPKVQRSHERQAHR
jgi:glycosyltransferase involved in cell wall biosynthesis